MTAALSIALPWFVMIPCGVFFVVVLWHETGAHWLRQRRRERRIEEAVWKRMRER